MERKEQIKIVDSWLTDLSKAIGTNFELDSEGICTFKIEEDVIAIEVSHDYPMVHLYSPLLALPSEDQEMLRALLVRALELNAFQIFTRGGAIATPPGGGFLIYCYSIPIEGTYSEQFSSHLGAFYETLPELKKMLAGSASMDIKKGPDLPNNLNFARKV
jgi:hypothetical protein